MSSTLCLFVDYPGCPVKLGKVIKYAVKKKKMSIIYVVMLNSEWGPIEPKDNRRVK